MKRRELERELRRLGWSLKRHGGAHDVWANADSTAVEWIPRHRDVEERVALAILKRAKGQA